MKQFFCCLQRLCPMTVDIDCYYHLKTKKCEIPQNNNPYLLLCMILKIYYLNQLSKCDTSIYTKSIKI